MNDKKNLRSGMYTLVGSYLLILVYQMNQGLDTAGNNRVLLLIFMVIFTIAGILMIIYGFRSLYLRLKEEQNKD